MRRRSSNMQVRCSPEIYYDSQFSKQHSSKFSLWFTFATHNATSLEASGVCVDRAGLGFIAEVKSLVAHPADEAVLMWLFIGGTSIR